MEYKKKDHRCWIKKRKMNLYSCRAEKTPIKVMYITDTGQKCKHNLEKEHILEKK